VKILSDSSDIRQKLSFFSQANYIAPRIVIVGAGAVDHEQFVNQVQSLFAKLTLTAKF
jgi:predicted Zn-dependent peptidase